MTSLQSSLPANLQSILDAIAHAFGTTPEVVRRVVWNLILTWVVVWIIWQVIKLVSRRIVAVADQHHGDAVSFREKRAATIAQLLRSVGWSLLFIVALLQTLRQFIDIAPLAASFAVLGLAVSFGAQSLVKDYLAGFFILFENQFVVGDAIEAAGKSGIVEKLTLRAVRLRDIEGTVHVIPNGLITTLSNKTRGWSRAVIDVSISYENDIDQVIGKLREEALAFYADPRWSDRFDAPPDVLGVESFAENGVSIRVLLRTKPGVQGEVAREFRRRVMIRLERDKVKGAHALQTIHVHPAGAIAPPPTVEVSPLPGPTS